MWAVDLTRKQLGLRGIIEEWATENEKVKRKSNETHVAEREAEENEKTDKGV